LTGRRRSFFHDPRAWVPRRPPDSGGLGFLHVWIYTCAMPSALTIWSQVVEKLAGYIAMPRARWSLLLATHPTYGHNSKLGMAPSSDPN
jgi:hypothetical protein